MKKLFKACDQLFTNVYQPLFFWFIIALIVGLNISKHDDVFYYSYMGIVTVVNLFLIVFGVRNISACLEKYNN